MTDTLYKEVQYILNSLISHLGRPESRWSMGYGEFLTARQPLIGRVIRAAYEKLSGGVA